MEPEMWIEINKETPLANKNKSRKKGERAERKFMLASHNINPSLVISFIYTNTLRPIAAIRFLMLALKLFKKGRTLLMLLLM